MLEQIFIVLGLLTFVDAMFDKYGTWVKIEAVLVKWLQGKSKLLFNLAFCQFCQRFWIGVVITVFVALMHGFTLGTLVVPFIVIGLFSLSNR